MVCVNLLSVDVCDVSHKQFLYEIVKYRWANHDIVNLSYRTDNNLPTYESHEKALTSGRYKHHYIIRLGETNIGSSYIDYSDTYGMFLLPSQLKKALKLYGKKNTELEIRPEPISVVAFKRMIELHPEITLYRATANPKNTLSRTVMVNGGHEEVEIILAIETRDGLPIKGEWPGKYVEPENLVPVNLQKVNQHDIRHREFLYEVLKYRWEHHELVNLPYRVDSSMPTYGEHVSSLASKLFNHHYIIALGEEMIGSCFIDKENTYSVFMLPSKIKKALKRYGVKNTVLAPGDVPLSVIAFKKMAELHPEITTFYASINPKNTLSHRVLLRGGHDEMEVILTQKTKNGKLVGGMWPDAYE